MAIELVTKFSGLVDERFSAESKLSLVTNKDYSFDGAHSVKVYSVNTAPMVDYDRDGVSGRISRYGEIKGLDATTQTLTLENDRSFTFAIDAMDEDETALALEASAALMRQIREVCVPEVDSNAYKKMALGAGLKGSGAITEETIYDQILAATQSMDNALVPDTGRVLIVPPSTYAAMKKNKYCTMETDVGSEIRAKGVIGVLDGANVIRIPASRLPNNCGFMLVHPSATCAPVKLESFKIHGTPVGICGSLVEGRIVYDAFVLENKSKGIYLHSTE